MNIEFDLSAFSEYELALAKMVALMRDMRPFWPKLTPLFIGWMRERFASEGSFGGEQWEPLSDQYFQWKQLAYPGKGILYATGQLRRQASRPKRIPTPTSIAFVIDDFDRKDGKRMEIDWFQKGTDRMPARPLIPDEWNANLPMPMRGEVETAAQVWVEEMAAKLGLR